MKLLKNKKFYAPLFLVLLSLVIASFWQTPLHAQQEAQQKVTVMGKVTDEYGYPIRNIDVTISERKTLSFPDGINYDAYLYSGITTKTDVNGNYTLSYPIFPLNDSAPVSFVQFSDPQKVYATLYAGHSATMRQATPYIFHTTTPLTINMTLPKGGKIQGKITMQRQPDEGFGNLGLFIYNGTGWEATTDYLKHKPSETNYEIGGLATGSYRLYVNSSSYSPTYLSPWYRKGTSLESAETINVKQGETTNNIDIFVPLEPTTQNTITGYVTDTQGKPLSNILVSLFTPARWYDEIVAYETTTDKNGRYTFSYLPDNSYKVQFASKRSGYYNDVIYASVYNDQRLTLGHAPSKSLQTGAKWEVNATLPIGASYQGSFTWSDGTPIEAYTVLWRWNDWDAWLRVVDYDDDLSVQGLQAGRYRLELFYTDDNNQQQHVWYGGGTTPESALEFTLKLGEKVTLPPFKLAATSELTGQVTDHRGQPLANQSVTLHRIDDNGGVEYCCSVFTDAQGIYYFHNIPHGRYRLLSYMSNTFIYYGNTPAKELATPIVINSEKVVANLQWWAVATLQINTTFQPKSADANYDWYKFHLSLLWFSGSKWYTITSMESPLTEPELPTAPQQYVANDLPAGRYKIEVTTSLLYGDGSTSKTLIEWYENASTEANAKEIKLTENQTQSINVIVEEK